MTLKELLAEKPEQVDLLVWENDSDPPIRYYAFDVTYRPLTTELTCSAWGMVVYEELPDGRPRGVVVFDMERPESMWQRTEYVFEPIPCA